MPLAVRERTNEWLRVLAATTVAWLLIESVTGLWIMLGSFGDLIQVMTLVHTVAGILVAVPWGWYLVTHWWRRREARIFSQAGISGYVALVSSASLLASGIVLTCQGIWGVRLSDDWRLIHQVATFALIAALGPHLTIALWRVWTGASPDAHEEGRAAKRLGSRVAGWCVVAGLLIVGLAWGLRTPDPREAFPHGYNFLYGADRPFAPSLARTSSGKAIRQWAFGNSESCGTKRCHAKIVAEWEPSAHRYSAKDPLFQAVQALMAKQNGPEATRYCAGCHDPISLFAARKMTGSAPLTTKTGLAEGISCIVCHTIKQVDVQGNASYVIEAPPEYLFDSPTDSASLVVRDFLIRSLGRLHKQIYSRSLYQTPEFCAACHKQFVDKEINQVGWVQLQNQYDNWKASHWYHKDDPALRIICRDCHMPLIKDSTDPVSLYATADRGPGAHRSHRFLGGNQFVPNLLHLPGAKEQTQLVEKWLKGQIPVPEIASRWTTGPVIGLKAHAVDSVVTLGDSIRVQLDIINRKAGHDVPTGPLDLIRAWVRLEVLDGTGRVLVKTADPSSISAPPVTFKAIPVNTKGGVLIRHNLWDFVGIRYKRSLFPGMQDYASMAVAAPPDAGKYRLVAEFCYLKAAPRTIDAILGPNSGVVAPITVMSADTIAVRVASR